MTRKRKRCTVVRFPAPGSRAKEAGPDRKLLGRPGAGGSQAWPEVVSAGVDDFIAGLVEYKQAHHPADRRRIVSAEVSTRRRRPIAEKLVAKMNRQARAAVVSFASVAAGRAAADELQKTVATSEVLAGLHPAYAAYVYAQNQVSVMSEQLTELKDLAPLADLVSKAEDAHWPNGPPISPLTRSYFTCWAFFDACVGPAKETIGTTILEMGAAFGMHPEMLRLIQLMQDSRMGLYLHEGTSGPYVVLQELVTDVVCQALVPAGYRGERGELWYARVFPPPLPGGAEHVVFTTPYVLLRPGPHEWLEYFRRTLADPMSPAGIEVYEDHLKYGPTRDYWNEFVFEAYVNHREEAIYLRGLPDIPESRPHSRVNRERF